LRKLRTQLQKLIQTRETKVNSGNVEDFSVYRQIVGEMHGLKLAIREIEDLITKRRIDDDDDDAD
jgi:hypothetical protein